MKNLITFLLFLCIIFLQTRILYPDQYSESSPETTIFDAFEEIRIASSPDEEKELNFQSKERLIDFCVLADNSRIITLLEVQSGNNILRLWDYKSQPTDLDVDFPDQFHSTEIIAHPQDYRVFLLGYSGKDSNPQKKFKIYSLNLGVNSLTEIYSDNEPLRYLTTSSSKFSKSFPGPTYYRLFFARENPDNTEILSITENGERLYPVVSSFAESSVDWSRFPPQVLAAPFAVPLAFHPSGDILFWRQRDGSIMALPYSGLYWNVDLASVADFASYMDKQDCIEFAPNGLCLIKWQPHQKNLTLLNLFYDTEKMITLNNGIRTRVKFSPDGKGIIFGTDQNELIYKPLNLPLYDVENAWMFCQDKGDMELLLENGGLFRNTYAGTGRRFPDQLYGVYETENYQRFNSTYTARPYFVTTDPFHEILEAAYSGLFYINERDRSREDFKRFIVETKTLFDSQIDPDYYFWQKLFRYASKIQEGVYDDEELQRIKNAKGIAGSEILQKESVNYAEFEPRAYYEQSEDMSNYFRAVQFIRMAEPQKFQWELLLKHQRVIDLLKAWVNSYRVFITQPRHLLPGERLEPISYVKHDIARKMTLFPQAWGIDNEILNSVVYHELWPQEEQVVGIDGQYRWIPDINELAYVFGSDLAEKILHKKGVYKQYPVLKNIHKELIDRWKEFQAGKITGVYDSWLHLMSEQISGKKPEWPWLTEELWKVKQLQTGLASWTNLRHATILVNERGMAQSGEGGLEIMIRKPPRGAVEPHPEAFHALILVFEELKKGFIRANDMLEDADTGEDEKDSFRTGIISRIDNVILTLQKFRQIAEKEVNQEPLSNENYADILHCGRAIQHDFLVFKSLMVKDHGLPNPEPMPKVVDVFGEFMLGGVLHCAVGYPLEWDVIVPYYGRRQVVKGGVYAFYDFIKPNPISDEEWRWEIDSHNLPGWIQPFLSKGILSWPAKKSFFRR